MLSCSPKAGNTQSQVLQNMVCKICYIQTDMKNLNPYFGLHLKVIKKTSIIISDKKNPLKKCTD